jgi:predicted permease
MATVVLALIPVFLVIVLGVVARRYVAEGDAYWVGIERILYYVLFPALLVGTLGQANLTRVPVAEVAGALILAVLLLSMICLALRPLLTRALAIDGPAFSSIFQGATRWQTFVALAVAGNLYGEFGLALASVAAIAMIPLLNVINVWVLARYASPTRARWTQVALAIARNPLIWSCLAGIAINVTRLPVPGAIYDTLDLLGRASLALGLLAVGAGLDVRGLTRPSPAAAVSAALKLVLMPAIAVALARVFGTTGVPLAVVACCAAVPSAPAAYVLARQMGGDTALLAQILVLQTLCAVMTLPIAIEIAARLS